MEITVDTVRGRRTFKRLALISGQNVFESTRPVRLNRAVCADLTFLVTLLSVTNGPFVDLQGADI